MGDYRNNTEGSLDAQFLQDLQRATRLSIESYKSEQDARKSSGNGYDRSASTDEGRVSLLPWIDDPPQSLLSRQKGKEVELKSRPRPSSRTNASGDGDPINDSQNLVSPTESPLTSIPPPCSFKRHRSLPYRRHITHPIIGEEVTPSGPLPPASSPNKPCPSDDLILLSSPLVTSKFKRTLILPSCDSNYSQPIDDISPSPTKSDSNSKLTMSNHRPGVPSLYPRLVYPPPPRSQIPSLFPIPTSSQVRSQCHSPSGFGGMQNHGVGTTSAVIGGILHDLHKTNSGIHPGIKYRCRNENTSPSTNAYKRVSDELRNLNTDDLIDFGSSTSTQMELQESGCKNILEYFDPLLIKQNQQREIQERQPVPVDTDKNKIDAIYNDSISSCVSTATSAFTYRPTSDVETPTSGGSLSLYPSLEDFEPNENPYATLNGTLRRMYTSNSNDVSNFYDIYNPFEYLYSVSCSSTIRVGEEHTARSIGFAAPTPAPPPLRRGGSDGMIPPKILGPELPPRNSLPYPSSTTSTEEPFPTKIQLRNRTVSHDMSKRSGKLYENIEQIKSSSSSDSEIQAFHVKMREIRFSCRHVDSTTNKGYIRSAVAENTCIEVGHSVKILVWPEKFTRDPTIFTSDVYSPVELVLEQSLMELVINGSARDYVLRVKERNEYLDGDILLVNYSYVQECIKRDEDVHLVIVHRNASLRNTWARTGRDDASSVKIVLDDILPSSQAKTITHAKISIPLGLIDEESERIRKTVEKHVFGENEGAHIHTSTLLQSVKAVCTLLKEVVTIEIVSSLNGFVKATDEWNSKIKVPSPLLENRSCSLSESTESGRRTKIIADLGKEHSYVEVIPKRQNCAQDALRNLIITSVERVVESVKKLVTMYSKSFPVSFRMKEEEKKMDTDEAIETIGEMAAPFQLRIGSLHRLKPEWLANYASFSIETEILHGTRWTGVENVDYATVTKAGHGHWFFNTVVFDKLVRFTHIPICILPRESRLVFTVYGWRASDDNNNGSPEVALGWASMQFFNFKGMMAQGHFLLPFWPIELPQKRLGPAPNSSFSSDGNSTLITVELNDFGQELKFPEVPKAVLITREFGTLDASTQNLLMNIVNESTFTKFPPEEYEILWEKRHYLHQFPQALPKVLLSAFLWDWASVSEIHAMLTGWAQMEPIDALQLLLPCFPDGRVRKTGIRLISKMSDEDLVNLLPQLVEALTYETFDLSPLAKLLLRKSLSSIPFSHSFFWMLASQIGLGKWIAEDPQTTSDPVITRISPVGIENMFDPKRRRLELMLNTLMVISGEKWRSALISQYKMIQNLGDIALHIKSCKDSVRQYILWEELQRLSSSVFAARTSIPLPTSASTQVSEINPNRRMSSYFNSNAVPLKVSFISDLPEGGSVSTIFKVGDDLQKDMLTLQTIRTIEKWWIKDGLDLRVLTFSCVPTGPKQGMVEMVPNAETLCKIQAEYGVTGVFRDSAIADWLGKMNPSTLDYRRATENFTLSCAAYCVVTYVLGICDRHNDNIMLTKKGHLFHIDFGKFLGDAQKFIKFKRDRTPFVLTSDMIYVINEGEKGSLKFHRFIELCCHAFHIVRQNGNVLVSLFQLMVSAGIPGVNHDSVSYIAEALLPKASRFEATVKFTEFIQQSSQSWFTPVNFFLHSLAQLRFSSDSNDNPTALSFVSTVYSMEKEGRIESVHLLAYKKFYDPEKHYAYVLRVQRVGQSHWSLIHRSYKEFLELRSKLCLNFPQADGTMKPLPKAAGIGRSNVKQVAEKRVSFVKEFLESLFTLADEISHSNLIYTFFHPILRDEKQQLIDGTLERPNPCRSDMNDPSRIHGQIKISLQYKLGALTVLILHAVDLACPNGQPPSPYVKTYLQPDSSRLTKRKTRVVRRSKHPSFMEMIEYRLPLEVIQQRILQVSIWHYDPLQENNFLGGVLVPLINVPFYRGDVTETFTLTNLTKVGI